MPSSSWDDDDRVTRINAAAETLTGWQAAEVIDRSGEELFLGELTPEGRDVSRLLAEIIEREAPRSLLRERRA